MNEKHLYLILLKVKNNTSISELQFEGLNYSEITELLKYIAIEKLIIETEDSIILSDSGNKKFEELSITYKKTNKKEWIKPDEKSLIQKLKKNDIFVPRSSELTFKIKLKK
ncbi:MAG: hypothetical protein ACN6OJ_00315 [Chryseobacterium sp.]|uniref:hypothetical protein n=1 Tax=Chryseobacterium TaxID=59732 RepID=UPI000553091E|nr:hypothetical protein [Chryseobacterium jejuense]MBP2619108.1 hypothetical protein [Chryseobacterium jejuense]